MGVGSELAHCLSSSQKPIGSRNYRLQSLYLVRWLASFKAKRDLEQWRVAIVGSGGGEELYYS